MKHLFLLSRLAGVALFCLSAPALAQSTRPTLPIPLGPHAPSPPPLTNLPPFVSIYDPKPAPSGEKPAETAPSNTLVPPPAIAPPEKAAPPAAAPAPTLSAEEKKARMERLGRIIGGAIKQTSRYNETFRNLSAEETRLSELIDLTGAVKQKRRVVCDLVVYQSRLDPAMAYEYRNAKIVDGKEVKQDEKHLEKFFQKLLKADSVRSELNLMNQESFQHDLNLGGNFYGLTLFQWREILDWAWPFVGYDLIGQETIKGRKAYVVLFHQLRTNERLEWLLPKGLGLERASQFTQGRLWLDQETLQILQAERALTLLFPGQKEPVLIWRQSMFYKPSPHAIQVPDKFISEYFYHLVRTREGTVRTILSGRLTSEFGEFKRFDVSSEEQEKKTVIK